MAARYALYYAPHRDEPLYRLMAPLFGRDCRDGSSLPGGPVAPAGVEHDLWTTLAKTPAHYSLHATLKAPFELRSTSESMLAALKDVCRKVAERHASTPENARPLFWPWSPGRGMPHRNRPWPLWSGIA